VGPVTFPFKWKATAMKNLNELFVHTLKDVLFAERQMIKNLPKMAQEAQSAELKQAFEHHLQETEGQVQRLERVFELVGKAPRAVTCEAMQGLVDEAKEVIEEADTGPVKDAGLIASGQAIEHYEIARYGTLKTWAGALGMTEEVVEWMFNQSGADYEDTGGVGGTLAGNALSLAAVRATLSEVLSDEAFAHTIPLATRFSEGVMGVVEEHGLPWNVTQLGARAEYRFEPEPARNGTQAHEASDPELERFLHLHALNRGVLITPFHNMALMSPATSEADVDRHTEVFREAVADLLA